MVVDNKKIYSRLSLRAKKVLSKAAQLANNEPVKPEHILVSILLEVDSLAVSALKVARHNPITLIVMLGFGSYLSGFITPNNPVVTESLNIKDVSQEEIKDKSINLGESVGNTQINAKDGLDHLAQISDKDAINIGDVQSRGDIGNTQKGDQTTDNLKAILGNDINDDQNNPFDMQRFKEIVDGINAIDNLGADDLKSLSELAQGSDSASTTQSSDLDLRNHRLDITDNGANDIDNNNKDMGGDNQSISNKDFQDILDSQPPVPNSDVNQVGNLVGDIDFLGDLDKSLIGDSLNNFDLSDDRNISSDNNQDKDAEGIGREGRSVNAGSVNGIISADESLLFDLDNNLDLEKLNLTNESKIILSIAFQLASKHDLVYVGTEHLMLAVLTQKELPIVKEMAKRGLTLETYLKALSSIASYPIGLLAKPEGANQINSQTPMLSQIGVDLVEMAYKGKLDPLVGRQEEIDQLINILSRRKKNNPIIVGEAGVGKTVLVEGLAQRISAGQVPGSLIGMRIIALDVTNIIAGSKMRGDVEEKVMQIVNEAKRNRDIILFIDEIHNILNTSLPGGGMDIATILKPALVSGMIKCIGATTSEDFTRYFEEDEALLRRFHPVYIEEPSITHSIEILQRIKPILEEHHMVKISDDAVIASVKLSDRYISDRYLPDKAIDLLDEATASRRLESEVKYEGLVDMELKLNETIHNKEQAVRKGDLEKAKIMRDLENKIVIEIENLNKRRLNEQYGTKFTVGVDTVRKIIAKWTGIPIETIDRDETKSLLNLDKLLSQSVIGQDDAVKSVANAIKRARAGISSPDRPWASFMFLGPTGVGKTELAKVLTKVLFGDEDRLIQVDMSELMEMHSVSKLIGSPPGYVGYREGGQLTEAVKKNPHSVILFDEIEKAHPDVLNILLQVLEYGHLKDGKGKRINFKNTVIIMTSNIGAEEIRRNKIAGFTDNRESEQRGDKDIEKSYDSMKEGLMKQLKESLRPELLNRLDDIVIFRSLNRKDAKKIVMLLIDDLNKRLIEERVSVALDESAIKKIVKEGFSEEYGARPLRRLIQDQVETIVAEYILKRGHRDTNDKLEKITVHYVKDNYVIKKGSHK